VLAGSALVFVISDTFTRPLGSLVNGVRALEKGDYSYALDVRGRDEVSELTGAFQRMRDSLLNTQRELLEAERLATIGRMASSISHDLRHALAAIVANAEFLCESRLSSEQREELYQEVRVAVNQMTDLLDSLLEFSRTRESLRPSYSDLRNSIEHVVQTIRSHPEFHPIAIEIRQEGDASGWFDSKKLERAFYNLLLNACESVAPDNGRIEIVLRSVPGAVDIRFSDNGHGVPDSIRRELFEPFVSCGKENGTGLGLTVVQKIVQDHRGEINIEKTSAQGTTFRMLLPTGCSPKSPASRHEGMAHLPSFTQPQQARSE
jgi:signal transduction histidine kinase